MKKLILFSFPTFFMTIFCYGQNPYWKPGGNTNVGLDAVTPANNSLGTVAGNNIPIFFQTNGIQRMSINNGGVGNAAGRVAIFNTLPFVGFVPQERLHLHQTGGRNMIKFSTDNQTTTTGFQVGYNANSNINNRRFAEIHNYENTCIRFYTTGNSQRMVINPNRQSTVNGYNIQTPGYVGIGANNFNLWGSQTANGIGPFSLLHLNGNSNPGSAAEQSGFRPWMVGGITFTDNEDLSYVGIRRLDAVNRNEFVIDWSNNQIPGQIGPDDMVFRFTSTPTSAFANTINTTDLTSPNDIDGLHIARFSSYGNMGLGPTFGVDNPIYVTPQSLMHMSRNDTLDTWLQITNQFGTLQTANDGLRIGITGSGTAHVRQQENLPLIFYTNNIETERIIPNTGTTLAGNYLSN